MAIRLTDCIVGFLSFVLAASTIHLTSNGLNIAAVWPANAVLLAALLDRRPGTEAGVLVAGFLANLAANTLMRGPSAGMPLSGTSRVRSVGGRGHEACRHQGRSPQPGRRAAARCGSPAR